MLTFGGHKGSAFAAMVELLAGPLIGDMTSAESLAWDEGAGGLPYGGELILALDPTRFWAKRLKYTLIGRKRCLRRCRIKAHVCRASDALPHVRNRNWKG